MPFFIHYIHVLTSRISHKHQPAISIVKEFIMQRHLCRFALRMLIGILMLSMSALIVHGQQTTITDASKSAYDFDSLSGVIDADQVDYFSGNWSYVVPLGEVEGAGGLALPIRMRYSSAVTGTDRLIKLGTAEQISTLSKGTVTLNNATWVGLGWNLEFGAIRVTGGYELEDTTSPINHPFSFNLSLVFPDGSHRLVRQLDDSQRTADPGVPLPATNVYFAENRRFMDIRWNFDRNAPLASTWTVKTVSGLIYTFGAITIGEDTYGMNQTVKGGAVLQGRFEELMAEMVYQWNLAEIRDQAGNTIRFEYVSDGPVTTVRDRNRERNTPTRTFRNLLEFADLDSRYPGGISVPGGAPDLTVVKTFNTAHLSEVILAGADGEVVRKITTETSARPDIHIATYTPSSSNSPVKITYDNYFDTPVGETLPYGHHLVTDNRNYRMYDGLSSAHRLDALKVTDPDDNQIARYVFRYDGTKGGPPRPPVATGDNVRTLLLEEIAIMGTGNSADDQLPPYRFINTLADSYRITKVVTPAGGEMKIGYEGVTSPDTTLKYDDAYFDRSRRISHRIWDADGGGTGLPDTTAFSYIQTAPVMDIIDDRRVRRVTFPLVDEVLPGGHGKIRRDFVGEADLDALGLSATNRKHEAERDIRRGLLEETAWHDASGSVVQRERTTWQVTTQGTWTGRWQPYYHPGIPQQAYWIRADTLTTTRDDVSTKTVQTHNARNGLVASETLESGTHTLRVTDTSYHTDQVTSSPVALTFGQPVLNTSLSAGDRVHAAFLSSGDPPTASVEAFLNAGSGVESVGVYDFEGGLFPVSNHDVLRIQGTVGTDQLQGGDYMYAEATISIRWKDGGSFSAATFVHDIPSGGGLPAPKEEAFDVLVPVSADTDSAQVNLELRAAVYKEAQPVYRRIRVYAKDIVVTGMSSGDPEDVFLQEAHILDRPHVVTVKDGSGTRLQSTRYRYGRFNERGVRIVMPDTTSVWLDGDADGQMDEDEWLDRQVATGYDAYGNLTESRDAHGTVITMVTGYGKMRPVASFAGAAASQVAADVFDDHADWNELAAPGGPWTKTAGSKGVIDVKGGVLAMDNAVARRALPASESGVFECDVRMDADNERTTITLGNNRLRWIFDRDGKIRIRGAGALKDTGRTWRTNRWYRLRIAWDGSGWWARLDGVRHPEKGVYTMKDGGRLAAARLGNGARAGGASFDNVRVWPAGAQPAAMTTWDPVTLDAVAVTDPNGHTERYARDGLRRVVQTIDGKGRLTVQRDHRFSRGIGGTSAYNTARPNRQTDIAYPSRDGHKDLSGDGHRVVARGTGSRLEEGVSLETAGPYVVASGETVDLRASVRIRLTTGFQANAGAEFRAMLDPLAGGDEVTGSGGIAYNQEKEGKRSVKLGPTSVLETGRLSGHVTARADFHPASATSGKTVILSFGDGDDHVRVVYENGSVKLESRIGGIAASPAFEPGYSAGWPWARVEMELLPTGTVNAWLYDHRQTRFKGASASVAVPANWTPLFTAEGEHGNGYLAGLYVGKAEVVTAYYDGLARQIQTRARAENNDIVTQTTYNRVNKPDTLLGPSYLSSSHAYGALSEAAAGSRITRTTYDDDSLLRVSRIIPPGHTPNNAVDTRYGYWGVESGQGRSYHTVKDEKGVLSTNVYDAYGRLRYAISDSAGTSAATMNNRMSYANDALDRLVSTTMPGGGTSRYAYDTLGRMISRHHPDADGATLYKYDDLGRQRFMQDARQKAIGTGKVTYTVYDDFGRVTRVGEAAATFADLDPESTYPFESDAASWRSRMTYDDVLGSGPNYAQGRLTKVEENTDADAAAEVVHYYAYDHIGNVRVKKVEIEGLAGDKTLTYVHDLAGRVTRLVYPDDSQARYAYDSAGRLSRVWDAQGMTLAEYTYTAFGKVNTHVVGDGIVNGTYTYNAREWLTGIDYPQMFTMNQQSDKVGNVISQNYRRDSGERFKQISYSYDNLYRLTEFNLDSGSKTQSFVYDRNGNVTSLTTDGITSGYSYPDSTTPNRLDRLNVGSTETDFAYNENGAATLADGSALTYDYRGMVTGYGSGNTYTRDSDGFRVKKTGTGGTEYFLRGIDGTVLAVYNSNGSPIARYIYAGRDRLAQVSGGVPRYYIKDHLGSTRTLMASDGNLTATYDYWPYGEILASSGTDIARFKFTGHERDAESNLDFMQHRTHSSKWLRFLQIDPLSSRYPELSPYTYTGSNPINRVDLYGLEWSDTDGDGVADTWIADAVTVEADRYGSSSYDQYWSSTFDVSIGGSPYFTIRNITKVREALQGASYVSDITGIVQIKLLSYRKNLSIHERVNSSIRFYPLFRGLGTVTSVLGKSMYGVVPLGLYLDYHELSSGEISAARYTFRSIATGATVFATFRGGPLVGLAIGTTFAVGEIGYDILTPYLNELGRKIGNVETELKGGANPFLRYTSK